MEHEKKNTGLAIAHKRQAVLINRILLLACFMNQQAVDRVLNNLVKIEKK